MKKVIVLVLIALSTALFGQSFANSSDFVPGSKSIFNDQLNTDKIGEFPSGWTFGKGTIETVMFNGDKAIEFKKNNSFMEPAFNSFEYLPQNFSVEFDYHLSDVTQRGFSLYLYTGQKKYERLEIRGAKMQFDKAKGEMDRKNFIPGWKRLSLSYKDGVLKVYVNRERILNHPGVNAKFAKLAIECSYGDQYYIKNFRIGSYSGQEGSSQPVVKEQASQSEVREEPVNKPVVSLQPKTVSAPAANTGISAGSGASGNFSIVNAWWGSPLDGQRIDVTDLLNKKILFGKLTAIASNPFLNANLPKGEDKNLYIRYKTPAGEYEITVMEGDKTTIPDINRHRKAK